MSPILLALLLAAAAIVFVVAPLVRRPRAAPDALVPLAHGEGADVLPEEAEARAEAMVAAAAAGTAACPACGPRPEPDAAYCSKCGRHLGGCPACGAPAADAGARHCVQCGAALAGGDQRPPA